MLRGGLSDYYYKMYYNRDMSKEYLPGDPFVIGSRERFEAQYRADVATLRASGGGIWFILPASEAAYMHQYDAMNAKEAALTEAGMVVSRMHNPYGDWELWARPQRESDRQNSSPENK